MNNRRTTNYWPGFVDALSNMVLAMLFVILVLALAMGSYATVAADAMAKRLKAEVAAATLLQNAEEAHAAEVRARADAEAAAAALAARIATKEEPPSAAATEVPPSALAGTTRIGVAKNETSSSVLPRSRVLRVANSFVLEFTERTVTMDEVATKALRDALRPARRLLQTGTVDIVARAPGGNLTESRQASFYRAMAVRNVLMDEGMTADRIKVLVPDSDELSGKLAEVRLVFRAAAP